MCEERERNGWDGALESVCLVPKRGIGLRWECGHCIRSKVRQRVPGKLVLSGPFFLACERGNKGINQEQRVKSRAVGWWDWMVGRAGSLGRKEKEEGSSRTAVWGVGNGPLVSSWLLPFEGVKYRKRE